MREAEGSRGEESSVVIKQLANCDACVWLVAERMTGLITRDVLQHKVTIS